ncbi:hypothetical protein M1247_05005 [Mycobacterium sp. 21AC1]|nr:hypothetical protein [Mycobacterium sp. 21AC1]MDV3124263.1 hypothetical protein [Mycobacterium sp. 21AC1]
MTDYLVDDSVWARLATGDEEITARLRRIDNRRSSPRGRGIGVFDE